VPLENLVGEVAERYNVYFIVPGGASNGGDREVPGFWRRHLGRERVITLDSPEDTSECIALTIGMNEGVIGEADAATRLRTRGPIGRAVNRVVKTVGSLVTTSGRARRL
jgi:hypothetical protein